MIDEINKTCSVSVCENWTASNNCKRCEYNCKYFGLGGCKLEWERCYKITDCYYKQLLFAKSQLEDARNIINNLENKQ